jgi:hypothetical protein
MRSAYAEYERKEPNFTNYARVKEEQLGCSNCLLFSVHLSSFIVEFFVPYTKVG